MLYWKGGQTAAKAAGFFEDTLRYLYMPRLKTRDVLAQAILAGAASKDFFGTAYGEVGAKFEGFSFGGGNVVFDDILLLIEPHAAQAYEDTNQPAPAPAFPAAVTTTGDVAEGPNVYFASSGNLPPGPVTTAPAATAAKPKTFYGSAEVPPATVKMRLVQIAEEIVSISDVGPQRNRPPCGRNLGRVSRRGWRRLEAGRFGERPQPRS